MAHRKNVLTGKTKFHARPKRDDYKPWKNPSTMDKMSAKRELRLRKDDDAKVLKPGNYKD